MSGLDIHSWRVEVDRHSARQPSPALNHGGDCGLCCISGLLGHGTEFVREAYRLAYDNPDTIQALSLPSMVQALKNLCHRYGLAEEVADYPVQPRVGFGRGVSPWGYPADHMFNEWLHQLRTHLEAGYVGVTEILYSGGGRTTADFHYRGSDHWVLLTGARSVYWEDRDGDGKFRCGGWHKHVKVSCSMKGDYWLEVKDFLTQYGGFHVLFVRPVPAPPVTEKSGRE